MTVALITMGLGLGDFGAVFFKAMGFGFQDIDRRLSTSWVPIPTAAGLDALQWLGPESERVTIRGVIFPLEFGGLEQVETLRAAAQAGQPATLVSLSGAIGGRFAIEGVSEQRGLHDSEATPRRDAYRLSLARMARRA